MTGILIRRAVPADAEGILHAHREAVLTKAGTHYAQNELMGWARAVTPETIAEQKDQLTDPELIFSVAANGGRIIGFSALTPVLHELRAVYVAPGPWRVRFKFKDGHAYDIEIVDYH